MPLLKFGGGQAVPLVRQSEAAECGLAAVAMVAGYHGYETDMPTLRLKFAPSLKGMTLSTLMAISASIGLGARPLRCEPSELKQLKLPAILHWGMNHFVVMTAVKGDGIVIHDPALGRHSVDEDEVSRHFTGVALELSPNGSFRRKRERTPLKLMDLVQIGPQEQRALTQILVLSFVFESLVIAGPFYVQLVIDHSLVKGDTELLTVLAVAFACVLIFRTAAQLLRSLTEQFISRSLTLAMQTRLFFHLVRLPLEWFHKRQIGDIQNRFSSVEAIQSFFSNGALVAVIDAALGSLILALMIWYSTSMSLVVVASFILYALLRVGAVHMQQRVAGDLLVAQSAESTKFLESIRAAETLKAASAEVLRDSQQRNAIARTNNSMIRAGNVDAVFRAAESFINGAVTIIIVYVGARLVMASELTVGMLTAFIAYKSQLEDRFTRLVQQVINWRLLRVHVERLSDIALATPEIGIGNSFDDQIIRGELECRSLYFTYGFGEPRVIDGLSLKIDAGEHIAITGVSGSGKTTLLKLIAGLYRASGGEILIDSRPLTHWDIQTLRKQVAIVSQDDTLLAGSLAENISFFAETLDQTKLERCARMARIHDEIMRMPMGYQSLVGDMGSALSGGQKQRVLLARALYREPKILMLDEGTSHLDVENERAINKALASLPITRIIVAHRPETIRSAARVVHLEAGRIASDLKPEKPRSTAYESFARAKLSVREPAPDPIASRSSGT